MSDPIMRRLSGAVRPGVFLGVIVIMLLALFLPGVIGALLIVAIVIALATLLSKTWPVTSTRDRAIRVVILIGLLVLAVVKTVR